MENPILFILSVLLLCLGSSWASWLWMGISAVGVNNPANTTKCSTVPGLVLQQVLVCQAKPHVIPSVSEGARLGIRECQRQFEQERWNCTASRIPSVFGQVLEIGSKETAFVYAITSAGVVHAVTKSCSRGVLADCSCDMVKQTTRKAKAWKWGGCSDDLKYGLWFSRTFVDAPEYRARSRKRSGRYLMNLHNNEAGRQIISQHLKMNCRCHGVSGTCAVKTCWRTLSPFQEIGQHLKAKYAKAVEVSYSKKRRKLKRKQHRKMKIGKDNMVFMDRSPNYCSKDVKLGIAGTSGRVCNKTSTSSDRCSLLCCGNGYNTMVVREVHRCNCKFHWCCYVSCKQCEKIYDKHTCK